MIEMGLTVNNFWQSIKNLSPGRLASLAAIIIFLVSFLGYMVARMSSTEYAVLYTDLELEDAKQIISRLETDNVKYKLTKNGTEVMVPVDLVNKLRVDTAEIAMASGGANVGYEIFDHSDALGSTNFVQNVNLIRALEGELGRTIRTVDNIKNARVHLVLPKREMFSREEQPPSASVVIKTVKGPLSPQSIQAIQKLIAASVPKLDVKNVAIVDNAGNLLTKNYEDPEAMTAANNEILRLEQERKMGQQVQSLLERTIGEGKVRAQVNLEMDFDQVVTKEEIFDPDTQVVRSQATVTEEGINNTRENPVTVAQNIPNGDVVTTGNGTTSQSSRTEETINYEISKVVRNKVKNTGSIKRLTVAVMVDGIYEKGADGKMAYRSRTPVQEILIMGFTKDELIRIAEGIGVAIVAILVILLVIRPLVNNAFDVSNNNNDGRLLGSNPEDDNLLLSNFLSEDDSSMEELINLNKIDGRVKVSSLKKVNDIVEKNPDAAVNVIRTWLYSNDNN